MQKKQIWKTKNVIVMFENSLDNIQRKVEFILSLFSTFFCWIWFSILHFFVKNTHTHTFDCVLHRIRGMNGINSMSLDNNNDDCKELLLVRWMCFLNIFNVPLFSIWLYINGFVWFYNTICNLSQRILSVFFKMLSYFDWISTKLNIFV